MLSQRWPLAKTWILSIKQAGFGVAGASGLVASVFLTLKAVLIDSGSMNEVPLVRGMRQTLQAAIKQGSASESSASRARSACR